jgi:integrase
MERRGAVDHLPSGKWRVRVTEDSGKRSSLGTFETKSKAEDVLTVWLRAKKAKTLTHKKALKLRDFAEDVLKRRAVSGVKMIASERSNFKLYVKDSPLGHMALASVRRKDALAFVRDIPSRLSPATRRQVLHLVRVVFNHAVDDELVSVNPFSGIRVQKADITKDPWSFWALEDQKAFIECDDIPLRVRLLVAFAIGSGLRLREQWALRLEDVQLAGRKPTITVRYGKKFSSTKTNKIRRIPITPLARWALEKWLPMLPEVTERNLYGLVFPSIRGGFRDKSPMGWHRYQRIAGVPEIRWHDLRHTCASSLVSGVWGAPWPLEAVRDFLGHSSITMTQRYAHLARGVLDDVNSRLSFTPNSIGHEVKK